MSPSTLSDELKSVLVDALRPYASRIELFGSVARDNADSDSDVDVLVTLRPTTDRPPLGLKWFSLERHLSEALDRPVELVTEQSLSPHARPYVESDRVLLYEDE